MFMMVTVAPGKTPPVASVTAPLMSPDETCDCEKELGAALHVNKATATITTKRRLVFIFNRIISRQLRKLRKLISVIGVIGRLNSLSSRAEACPAHAPS